MISKADIVRSLRGKRVLDIGGTGYGESNAYERELAEAWRGCTRIVVDNCATADYVVDLNSPFVDFPSGEDVATAFDVLEHLERPVDVLRAIPCKHLIVTVPNALSPIARRIEHSAGVEHLYSFTEYTARRLVERGGWCVIDTEYQFGRWSLFARIVSMLGEFVPSLIGTGIALFCERAK